MKQSPVDEQNTGLENKPTIDTNIIAPYLKEFNKVQMEHNVKNIALMGPYGSGKSTILESLKNENPEKYISVSMMEFTDEVEKDNTAEQIIQDDGSGSGAKQEKQSTSKQEKIRKVEQSIIQQLIYQVPQKKIPQSKIKKEHSSKKNVFIHISIFVLLLLLAIIFFTFQLQIQKLSSSLYWAMLGFILVGTGYFLFRIIYYIHKNYRVSKITAKTFADIECNKYESVYNHFLDELVYFFKSTEYDTVIFEDIDRYNDIVFFSHLRELNTLLNNSQYLKKKITFIYAVKEELFVKQDKHKFFDAIIPVVPITDYKNSFDKFKEFIEDIDIKDETLKILSAYVYDLRTIKNIANEYRFFTSLQNITIYNKNSLLAILVFKNLYPQEFAKLQYNESIIDRIFKAKESEIEKIKQPKREEIEHLTRALKDEEYCIDPKYSLLGLIKEYINRSFPRNNHRAINCVWMTGLNGRISFSQIMDANLNWDEIRNLNTIKVEYNYGTDETIAVNNYIKEQIKELVELQKAKGVVDLKTKKQIAEQIEKLNFELNKYSNIKASTLYAERQDALKNILEQHQEKNKDILDKKFIPFVTTLILEDLINESYSEYISLNYGANINKNDQLFVQNVYASRVNDFDLNLSNIDILYNELKDKLHNNKYVFNFDIILFLAKQNQHNLEQLLQVNKDRLNLLYDTLDCNYQDFSLIASSMLQVNSSLLIELLSKEEDKYKCDMWLRELLCLENSVFKDITISVIVEKIQNYDLIYFSQIGQQKIDNLIGNLKSQGIRFSHIAGCQENEILFKSIKENCCFAFNYENLQIINAELNYEELLQESGVGAYVQNNIKQFVKILVDKQVATIQSQNFHALINSNIKDENLLVEYYKYNPIKIEDTTIFKNDKVRLELSKDTDNAYAFLEDENVVGTCAYTILNSLNEKDIENNVMRTFNILKDFGWNNAHISMHIYEASLKNLEEQADKDFLLEKIIWLITNERDCKKILKAYDSSFNAIKKDIVLDKIELNEKIVNKLEEFDLYDITEEDEQYILSKKRNKTAV